MKKLIFAVHITLQIQAVQNVSLIMLYKIIYVMKKLLFAVYITL